MNPQKYPTKFATFGVIAGISSHISPKMIEKPKIVFTTPTSKYLLKYLLKNGSKIFRKNPPTFCKKITRILAKISQMKKIYIEISDICGLKCSFCPAPKGVSGVMDLGLFNKAVFESKHYTNLIALHILGDPLSVENLANYLAIAKMANLKVEITTSGANLNDFDLLLQSPIKQVNFSLDALNEVENRDFLLGRIADFCAYKRQNKSEVFVNLRVQKRARNRNLVAFLEREFGVKNLAQFLGKSTKSKGANWDSILDSRANHNLEANRIKLGDKIIIDFREVFAWNLKRDSSDSTESSAIRGTCHALNHHIGILSNGEIIPCCMDFSGILSLGNIKDSSIKSALTSHRAQEMLKGFKENRIVEPFCKVCDYRKCFDLRFDSQGRFAKIRQK